MWQSSEEYRNNRMSDEAGPSSNDRSNYVSPDRDNGRSWRNDRDPYKSSSRYSDDYNADVSDSSYKGVSGGVRCRERSPRDSRDYRSSDSKRDDRKRRRYKSSRSRSRTRSRSRSRGSSSSYSKGRRSPRGDDRDHRDRESGRHYRDRRDDDSSRHRSSWRDEDRHGRRRSPTDYDRDRKRDSDGRTSDRDKDSSRTKDDWLSHVWSEGYRQEILEIDRHSDHSHSDYYERRTAYRSQSPNRTLIIRGLALDILEEDIREEITKGGIIPKDIRLIRKKETGSSRGFAFIEFYTVEEAISVMEEKDGELRFSNSYRIPIQYSIQREPEKDITVDWYCKCSALNFKRREHCYRCGSDRKTGECTETDEISSHPTHTVILKGLDILTTEEDVLKAIQSLSSLPIRSVRIGRDKISNISRGVCYLEMNNVSDAMYLHNTLLSEKLTIDNKQVYVLYSRGSSATSSIPTVGSACKAGDAAVAAAQWSHQKVDSKQHTLSDVPKLAEYSAALYAKSQREKEVYIKHYTDYYTKTINEGGVIPSLDASSSNPIQTGFNSSSTSSSSSSSTTDSTVMMTCAEPPCGDGEQTYPVPDVSTYQFDKTSGYFYDPFTTLYYDANSQYYYNSKLNKFLYWDGGKKTYLSAPSNTEESTVAATSPATMYDPSTITAIPVTSTSANIVISAEPSLALTTGQQRKTEEEMIKKQPMKTVEDKDKVKVAKRIAKDMEKWAKTLNQKKEVAKMNIISPQSMPMMLKNAAAADIGYAVLGRKESAPQNNIFFSSPADDNACNKMDSLVAEYGRGSESEEEITEELQQDDKHVDWNKMACLLCKRQFPNKETLLKHQQLSDLHKQNLEAWYRSIGISYEDASRRSNQYRDRAKERRTRYNEPDTPQPSKLKESYIKSKEATINYEQPNQTKIGGDNLGNKLLQKMGWQEGMGLGKSNQGRTDIIQAQARPLSAGLGTRTQGVTPGPGETYKECVKKMMRSRYEEIDIK